MVRKTKEDAELTYTALLDAAEQVFFEKGVARTTLNDIAAAAGMTRGAIYWHFKDKGALLQAMFDRALLPMEAMLNELPECPDTDALGTLRRLFIHALTQLGQSGQQQRVLDIMFHKCESTGDQLVVMQQELAHRDACLTQCEGILQKAVVQGQLPPDTDVFLSLQVVHNFIVGTMHQWLSAPQRYALDTAAPAMVDMLLAGLRSNPPRRPSSFST
jgi:TetR/AcrR family acrAB operon transcriptional repressor